MTAAATKSTTARKTTQAAKDRQSNGKAVEVAPPSRVLAKRKIDNAFPVDLDTASDYAALSAALAEAGIELPTIDEDRLVDIEALEGKPLIVVDFRLIESDKYLTDTGDASTFVACTVVAEDMGRVVFTTGAHGIVQRVQSAIASGVQAFRASGGVKRSTFDTTDARGKRVEATSWWFAA